MRADEGEGAGMEGAGPEASRYDDGRRNRHSEILDMRALQQSQSAAYLLERSVSCLQPVRTQPLFQQGPHVSTHCYQLPRSQHARQAGAGR